MSSTAWLGIAFGIAIVILIYLYATRKPRRRPDLDGIVDTDLLDPGPRTRRYYRERAADGGGSFLGAMGVSNYIGSDSSSSGCDSGGGSGGGGDCGGGGGGD